MMLKLALLIGGVFQSIQLSQTGIICYQVCNSTVGNASCSCAINGSNCCYQEILSNSFCSEIETQECYNSNGDYEIYTCMYNILCQDPNETAITLSDCDKMAKNGEVPALGAVVGLLVLALIVTTTGWVWTCCLLKKKGKMDVNSQQIDTLDTTPPGTVRQLHNPTYDGNNMQPPPPTTATDQAHSRDAISVVITPQEGEPLPIISNDQLDTMEQQQSIPRLSNNSQHVNVGGETETNIYYVLERPGDDDDYEDLDAELDAAEERAQAENNQGANLHHVQERPTLETEGSENTTKEAHVNGE